MNKKSNEVLLPNYFLFDEISIVAFSHMQSRFCNESETTILIIPTSEAVIEDLTVAINQNFFLHFVYSHLLFLRQQSLFQTKQLGRMNVSAKILSNSKHR